MVFLSCLFNDAVSIETIYDGMINECGETGAVRIGGEPKVLGESPVQFHFVHHKFHVT
jgi:hypothetical protein